MSDRVEQFKADVNDLKIKDPAAARDTMLLRIGVGLMVLGLGATLIAYLSGGNDTDPIEQGKHTLLALLGVTGAIIGAALFLRFSLSSFLKLWLARMVHHQRTGE